LVATLGERAPTPWWRSQASTEVSGRWLERLFPRTAARAALEIGSRAALAVHDARLGGTGVYHLFRLPVSIEATIQDLLARDGTSLDAVVEVVRGETALDLLGGMAGPERADVVAGPTNCGRVSSLQRGRGLQRICAAYFAAFKSATPAYPYLEADTQ
jgi:hypothetical protein